MKIVDLPGRYYGVDRMNAAALAHKAAMRDAISLIALSGTSYLPNSEIAEELTGQIIDRVTSFSIHARRALEIYDIRGTVIEGGRWKFAVEIEDYDDETSLFQATNTVLHARKLRAFIMQRNTELFREIGHEWVVSHIEAESDRNQTKHISPWGMAYSYLNAVAGHVSEIQARM